MEWTNGKIIAEVRQPTEYNMYYKFLVGLKGYISYRNIYIDNQDKDYSNFLEQYEKVIDTTIIDLDRAFILYQAAIASANIEGCSAECGVYKGGGSILIAMNRPNSPHYAMDTFEGFPDVITDLDLLDKGGFSEVSNVDLRRHLGKCPNIFALKGPFSETFKFIEDKRFSFVHFDSDLYVSTLECLQFFYPRFTKGGIMLFDDYLIADTPGVKKAVDEFFATVPECPIILPTSQAIVYKL